MPKSKTTNRKKILPSKVPLDFTLVPDIDAASLEAREAELLTNGGNGTIGMSVGAEGTDSMPDDPRLEKAFELIRQVVADERQRTIDDIMKGVQSGTTSARRNDSARYGIPEKEKGQRAPAGSARLLCERVLTAAAERGLTTNRIHELASTEYERMLSVSAIRNELGVGEKAKPPRYRSVGGVWYLAQHAPPTMRVVG